MDNSSNETVKATKIDINLITMRNLSCQNQGNYSTGSIGQSRALSSRVMLQGVTNRRSLLKIKLDDYFEKKQKCIKYCIE